MAVTSRRLDVVQICDHLGWPGTRMHGVKRLFAWMIPRFDAARFRVRLVSLRAPDTSGDRLEDHGIDVTYLSRSKFDPRTLPALLADLDRRGTDVVELPRFRGHLMLHVRMQTEARLICGRDWKQPVVDPRLVVQEEITTICDRLGRWGNVKVSAHGIARRIRGLNQINPDSDSVGN